MICTLHFYTVPFDDAIVQDGPKKVLHMVLSKLRQISITFDNFWRWHKLSEVNECTSHNSIVLAICEPKVIKLVKIWQSSDKNKLENFFGSTLYCAQYCSILGTTTAAITGEWAVYRVHRCDWIGKW